MYILYIRCYVGAKLLQVVLIARVFWVFASCSKSKETILKFISGPYKLAQVLPSM